MPIARRRPDWRCAANSLYPLIPAPRVPRVGPRPPRPRPRRRCSSRVLDRRRLPRQSVRPGCDRCLQPSRRPTQRPRGAAGRPRRADRGRRWPTRPGPRRPRIRQVSRAIGVAWPIETGESFQSVAPSITSPVTRSDRVSPAPALTNWRGRSCRPLPARSAPRPFARDHAARSRAGARARGLIPPAARRRGRDNDEVIVERLGRHGRTTERADDHEQAGHRHNTAGDTAVRRVDLPGERA